MNLHARIRLSRHSGLPGSQDTQKDLVMDKDRSEGPGKQVSGSIKEAVGKVTGNTETQAEGKVEKTAGKGQNILGKGKNAVRDTIKE